MTDLAGIVVNDQDLATLAGVTARHIRRLDLPKAGRNAYNLAQALPALIAALGGQPEDERITTQRCRLVKAQADRAELELARAKGDVAPIDEFRNAQTNFAAAVRVNILNVAQRAVLQLLGETDEATFKRVLLAELTLALEQSAQAEFEIEADDPPGDRPGTNQGTPE